MSTATRQQESAPAQPSADGLLDRVIAATPQESPDLAALRMENEVMLSECRMRPRDIPAIKRELAALLCEFPLLADEVIYSKPVGKDPLTGKMKYAEGLSIRAAEVLAEVYGYNRVRCDCTPLDADVTRVKVEASFTDFQRCRTWHDGGVISAYYKTHTGAMARHPEDRFLGLVVKAEAGRRVREVILRSVNAALKAWFEAECRKVLEQTLTPDKLAKIIAHFRTYRITQGQLEAYIGKSSAMGWTNTDLQRLLGLFNAIRDGETTAKEAFARPEAWPRPLEGQVEIIPEPPPAPADAQAELDAMEKEYREGIAQCAKDGNDQGLGQLTDLIHREENLSEATRMDLLRQIAAARQGLQALVVAPIPLDDEPFFDTPRLLDAAERDAAEMLNNCHAMDDLNAAWQLIEANVLLGKSDRMPALRARCADQRKALAAPAGKRQRGQGTLLDGTQGRAPS